MAKYLEVEIDIETSEHAGADGMFQIMTVRDSDGKDVTEKVDVGIHFPLDDNYDELKAHLKEAFNTSVDVNVINND